VANGQVRIYHADRLESVRWVTDGGQSTCALLHSPATLLLASPTHPSCLATRWQLLPADQFRDFRPPAPFLPRSPGHHREWVLACKGENITPMSNFVDYAAYLTEIVLLGNLAIRLGGRIEWDAATARVRGRPEAEPLVHRPYRKGWTL